MNLVTPFALENGGGGEGGTRLLPRPFLFNEKKRARLLTVHKSEVLHVGQPLVKNHLYPPIT